jgi:hypothetical protein
MADDTHKTETGAASEVYVSKVDRRAAIAWIGAAAAGVAIATGAVENRRHAAAGPRWTGTPGGYGTDPKLVDPAKAPWPRILTQEELQVAAALSDFILPATATAPSASALGVPDFIDEWVSAPYPDQQKDRPIIRAGLRALVPAVAKGDAGKRAAALAALPRTSNEQTRAFFKRFRALTIGAYYTTEAGFKDIGYIGNVARGSDPGPSDAVKAALDVQLKKLGL